MLCRPVCGIDGFCPRHLSKFSKRIVVIFMTTVHHTGEVIFTPIFKKGSSMECSDGTQHSFPARVTPRTSSQSMLSQAPLLCALVAFLQHLSRPRPPGSPSWGQWDQFFGKLDREWLWQSVHLSLSNKGHRKTFAKNKLSEGHSARFSGAAPSVVGRG